MIVVEAVVATGRAALAAPRADDDPASSKMIRALVWPAVVSDRLFAYIVAVAAFYR